MARVRDADIAAAVLGLLARRACDASICPSEAARALGADDWRDLMPAVRAAAADLARRELVRATQGARCIEPDAIVHARGPIRLRRGPKYPPKEPSAGDSSPPSA
jgi:hypothetical protein